MSAQFNFASRWKVTFPFILGIMFGDINGVLLASLFFQLLIWCSVLWNQIPKLFFFWRVTHPTLIILRVLSLIPLDGIIVFRDIKHPVCDVEMCFRFLVSSSWIWMNFGRQYSCLSCFLLCFLKGFPKLFLFLRLIFVIFMKEREREKTLSFFSSGFCKSSAIQ